MAGEVTARSALSSETALIPQISSDTASEAAITEINTESSAPVTSMTSSGKVDAGEISGERFSSSKPPDQEQSAGLKGIAEIPNAVSSAQADTAAVMPLESFESKQPPAKPARASISRVPDSSVGYISKSAGVRMPTKQIVTKRIPDRNPALAPGNSAPISSSGLKGTSWLMEQNPEYFTVQLFTSISSAALENFVIQNELYGVARYTVQRPKEGTLYILVQGIYPDAAIAESIAQILRARLNLAHTPVLRLNDIQGEIKAAVRN